MLLHPLPPGLHQAHAGFHVPDAAPRRPRRQRPEPQGGGRGPEPVHRLDPRLSAVLHQRRPGAPPEGVPDPGGRPYGPGHGHRQHPAPGARRDRHSHAAHPGLCRRQLPVDGHPQRHRQAHLHGLRLHGQEGRHPRPDAGRGRPADLRPQDRRQRPGADLHPQRHGALLRRKRRPAHGPRRPGRPRHPPGGGRPGRRRRAVPGGQAAAGRHRERLRQAHRRGGVSADGRGRQPPAPEARRQGSDCVQPHRKDGSRRRNLRRVR